MQYLIAIYHPDDYDGSREDAAMHKAIDDLNDDMVARGVRRFVCGLQPAQLAKSVKSDADGNISTTEGPYLQSNEHIGGFWVIEVEDEAAALEWGRRATVACQTPVQVRPLF